MARMQSLALGVLYDTANGVWQSMYLLCVQLGLHITAAAEYYGCCLYCTTTTTTNYCYY